MAKEAEKDQQITKDELEALLANAEAEKEKAVQEALKKAEEEKEAALAEALKKAEEEKKEAVEKAMLDSRRFITDERAALYEPEENKPPETKMVTIKIEKNKNDRDDVFVCVNGKNFQIKRGEVVEVPEYVCEVLENMKRMDELAIERMEEATKRFA